MSFRFPARFHVPRLATVSTLFLAALAGCESSNTTGAVTGLPATAAYVRVVQAVSDANNGVDLSLNGTLVLSGAPFGSFAPTVQGGYLAVPIAPQLALYASGSTTAFYNKPVPTLAANAPFTIVTLGRVAAGAATTATATILTDTTASANGAVLVRVFNALDYLGDRTGTRADVYIYPQGAARPSAPAVAGLAYNAASPYVLELGANFVVDVYEATAPTNRAPLFTGVLTAGPGAVRTMVLLDPAATAPAGTSGRVLVLNDQL